MVVHTLPRPTEGVNSGTAVYGELAASKLGVAKRWINNMNGDEEKRENLHSRCHSAVTVLYMCKCP